MNVLLVGPIKDNVSLDGIKFDSVIAVDKGLENAINRNLKVDVAIGDFDSLSDKNILSTINVVLELNEEKDESDFECALKYIKNFDGIENVYSIGFMFGNRIDHMLSNLLLMYKYCDLNINFIQEKSEIYLLNSGKYNLENKNHKYISFFSLDDVNITLGDGFKYKVSNEIINKDHLKFISNEIIKDTAYIEISDKIIIIKSND